MNKKDSGKYIAKLRRHNAMIKQIEMELKKPTIDRMALWKIKKIAEDELYRLSELTIQYPDAKHTKLDEYKERLWLIMGVK